ncbi:MAG: Microbial collagenase precursor [Bacteroidetes bacterium]|nr:Microbial collagenase precursor [Bacteroidota bacterium]
MKSTTIKYTLLSVLLLFAGKFYGQCPQIYDGLGAPSANPIWISCSGGAYTLNFALPTAITSYTIDWGDASGTTTGASLNANTIVPHNYTAAIDTFIVTLTTSAPACVVTGLVVMEKPVNASIQIPIGGVTTTCAPAALQFSNASTDVSATTTFTWNFGDGSPTQTFNETNAGQTISHTYLQGTVNCQTVVTLTAQNYCSFGTPTSAQFNPIQIYDVDIADINADQYIRCWPDNAFTFTNTTNRNCVPQGNVDQRYEYWNLGDYWGLGHDSIIDWAPWPPTFPLTVAYPATGNYNITLLDSNRCGIDDVTITVSIVNPPTAGVTAPVTTACAGSTLTFNNTSSLGYSYGWNFGDAPGFSTTGFGPRTHTYNTAGTYTITIVAFIFGSASSCSDTDRVVVNILPRPVSSFVMAPSGMCDNITVGFTDASTDAVSWNWNFGNSNNSTSPTPPVQTYTVGTYTVSLQVTAANTCVHTSTQVVRVYQSPDADFAVANACVNSVVAFSDASIALPADPVTTWDWDFDDTGSSTIQNPSHAYTGSGTFNVELVVHTAHCSDSITKPVTINPLPVASFTLSPASGCSPHTVTFTNGSSGAASYDWSFGNGSTSTATDPAAILTNSVTDTTYYVQLIAITAFGCRDTVIDSVEVFGKPQANFNHSSIAGCAPVPVSFTNASLGAVSYDWNFGLGQGTSTATDPDYTFVNATSFIQTYSVTLIATSVHGCRDTLVSPVNINPEPLFGFTMVPDTGCSVLSVSFPAVAGAVLYEWDLGDGTQTTGTAPTHNYSNPGLTPLSFTVQLIATNAFNCKDTTQGVVVVNPRPSASFTTSQTTGCPTLDVNLVNTSVGATNYLWNFGDGSPTSTLTSTSHTFDNLSTTAGVVYPLKLVAENSYGCKDSVTQNITIHPRVISDFTADVPPCPPGNVVFSNTSQGASSYAWAFGDTQLSAASNPSHLYAHDVSVQLSYTAQLIASNSFNCRDTTTLQITINPKPVAAFVASVTSGCPALDVSFTNTSNGTATYIWNFGDGSDTTNVTSPAHTFQNLSTSSNAIYPVKLVLENTFGCKDSISTSITVHPEVVSDFTTIVPTCPPGNVTFNNNSQGATSYAWDFDDTQTSTSINPTHLFANDNSVQLTYDVQLIASNAFNCKDTIVVPVVINPKPLANFNPSQSIGCPALNVTLNNTSVGNTINTWSFGDGTPGSSAVSPVHDFDNTSVSLDVVYPVKLVVENSFGCKDSISSSITVHPMVVASFSADTPICSPVNVQFFNLSQGAATYFWDLDDFTTTTATSPSHSYTNNGPGTTFAHVVLTATSAFGCTDDFDHTYSIFPTPQAAFSATPTSQLYPATVVAINNTTPNAGAFTSSWDYGDTQTSSLTFPVSHDYGTWGTYTISLVMSSPFCRDSTTQVVEIIPPIPVAGFKGTKEGCRSLEVSFQSLSQYENNYLWKFGDGNTSNQQNPTHTYNAAGVYDVTLIVFGDGGSDTLVGIDSVTVYDLPQAAFIANPVSVNAATDQVFCTNISVSPDGTALSYIYNFGDNTALETSSDPSHVYQEAGEFQITQIVTNTHGCVDTFVFSPRIKVEEQSSFTIPNAFTPNPNGGSEDGIYDAYAANNDIFHPVIRGVKKYELLIYSRWGELLFQTTDLKKGWDGYYKGKMCTQDVYIWKIVATTVDDKNFNKAGDVLLLKP